MIQVSPGISFPTLLLKAVLFLHQYTTVRFRTSYYLKYLLFGTLCDICVPWHLFCRFVTFFSCGWEIDDCVPFFPITEYHFRTCCTTTKPQQHSHSDVYYVYHIFVVNSISQPLCITFCKVLSLWSCFQDMKIVYFPSINHKVKWEHFVRGYEWAGQIRAIFYHLTKAKLTESNTENQALRSQDATVKTVE